METQMRKADTITIPRSLTVTIEAAIRWSDLMRFESRILHVIGRQANT